MTDNEIIKALEFCINNNGICEGCPLLNKRNSSRECTDELIRGALELINRQKAEIEKLKKEKDEMHKDVIVAEEYAWSLKTAKSEAIREFAENIKERLVVDCDRVCERHSLLCGNITGYPIHEVEECIDNLVKEMVGEDK